MRLPNLEVRERRAEAKRQGSKHYEGRPCRPRGHITRLVSSGACAQCQSDRVKKVYRNNPKYKARQLERQDCDEFRSYANESLKSRYANDPEHRARVLEYQDRYRASQLNQ